MPQVTVYIREGDVEKWKSIEKKAEFIHYALATVSSEGIKMHKEVFKKELSPGAQDTINAVKRMELDAPFVPRPPAPLTGYPCCQRAKPCKHWIFDGINSLWKNELTGKVREVL